MYTSFMQLTTYTMWEEQHGWRGYLKDHPDQVVQGKTFDDLQSKLLRLKQDLAGQSRKPGIPQQLPPQQPPRAA
jgi:hypothetical protein